MPKKKTADDGKSSYMALKRIATKAGDQVWNPGAEIRLDEETAKILLRKGAIIPYGDTTAPDLSDPDAPTVHDVKEPDNGDTSGTE